MKVMLSKKLRYFITAMETCCINTAAEQLHITRSPLGRVLYELESLLGGKLFERKYNHLCPTEMAEALYGRLKPVYDTLCSLEHEFNPTKTAFCIDFLFDISIPYNVFQSISLAFKKKHLPVTCRRISGSGTDILTLSANSSVALLTYRTVLAGDGVDCIHFKSEKLILCMPANLTDDDLKNTRLMGKTPLYIRKDEYFDERKGIIEYILKGTLDFINIQQTENDISSLLLVSGAGKGMFLLPESMASMFNHPGVKKVYIPDVELNNMLYINKKMKGTELLNEIIDVIKLYIPH